MMIGDEKGGSGVVVRGLCHKEVFDKYKFQPNAHTQSELRPYIHSTLSI